MTMGSKSASIVVVDVEALANHPLFKESVEEEVLPLVECLLTRPSLPFSHQVTTLLFRALL